jgi:hypothetical protein
LVGVAGRRHFTNERFGIEIVGFHQVIERVAMIPQLGVEQTKQKVGIHVERMAEVHGGKRDERECNAVNTIRNLSIDPPSFLTKDDTGTMTLTATNTYPGIFIGVAFVLRGRKSA